MLNKLDGLNTSSVMVFEVAMIEFTPKQVKIMIPSGKPLWFSRSDIVVERTESNTFWIYAKEHEAYRLLKVAPLAKGQFWPSSGT